jgi:uncharacterized membrane protein YraQ (UPF0718 family)
MIILYIITVVAVMISLILSREKTKKAFLVGAKKLWKITPPFITILIFVAVVLSFISKEMIADYLGKADSMISFVIAILLGSVTVMPGPIVYPLCAILVDQGVSYSVVAAFSVSLMMVGVVTFPVESAYFGKKMALLRNMTSLLIALAIAFVFSLVSGKLI